ncbi:hypothetical protein ACR6HW_11840 [Fusibacter sp. JL298sf-3]
MGNKNLESKIDELVNQFKNVKDITDLMPEFDQDALMVHWTNNTVSPT